MRRELTCIFCGAEHGTLAALKAHSAGCPEHPAVRRRDALLEACRFAFAHCSPAPGRDAEWGRLITAALADAPGTED